MKTLTCIAPGQFTYTKTEKPLLQKDHAIIRIHRIGICGTDLHAFEGTQPYFTYPRILGHELAGELVQVDGTDAFQKGETVTFMPYFYCGRCNACRIGKTNCCVYLQVCGVHTDGGMREYLLVPAYSLLHGNGLTYDELALAEPLAIGAHAIRRAAIQAGEYVLVAGAGPIGMGIAALATIAGANVIVTDINENRLSWCRHKLGVKHIINAANEDVTGSLKEITRNDMPSVVIDATGNLKAINTAFQYMAHGARYVLVGLQKEAISIGHPEFHKREATLMSSRNATKEDFEYVIHCIQQQWIKPGDFITHRVSFEKTGNEFVNWLNPDNGVIKAMVEI